MFAILGLIIQISYYPTFLDRTQELGLSSLGGNACWVDINGDGFTDLCAGGAVWINDKGQKFHKVADAGASVSADFDNDGYNDLFSWTSWKILKGSPTGDFSEIPLPELPPTSSRGGCLGDFNGDGFVDIFAGGFEDWDRNITYPSFLLMSEGGRSFKLTWTSNTYRTRGVTACDFDFDGDLDIYSSNYRLQENNLYINDGKGDFEDKSVLFNAVGTSPGFPGGHTIGSAWGDFDNDGLFDLFVGNFAHVDDRGDQPKSRFLRNLGLKGAFRFEDMGTCGVFYQESYASPAAADFNNDGMLDLYFTTVYPVASFERPNNPVLFQSKKAFKLVDVTADCSLPNLGATSQAAWADFDNDGDVDLVTDGKLFVNQNAKGNWVEISLHGDGKVINRSAIGSQVRIKTKFGTITRQVEAGTNEGNQNDLKLHFGLGDTKGKVNAEIFWPNGHFQTVRGIATKKIKHITFSAKK